MPKKNTYCNRPAKKIASLLLMILFLAIPLAQTLHRHHTNDFFNKNSTEKIISGAAEKCFVCDYTAQIKDKQILMAHPPTIDVPIEICKILNAFVYTRIYKFTLQNFNNKGPPCLL